MLALVRHGQTDLNAQGRLQGGGSDYPLNATGIEQASVAAANLSADGISWSVVVSSPQTRARQTAEIVATRLGLPLGPEYPDLRERDYGALEGVTEDEVERLWPGKNEPTVETLPHVVRRGLRALDEIRDAYAETDVVVVAHGTLIRYTLSELVGRKVEHPGNATVSLIEPVERTEENPHGWRVLTVGGEPVEAESA